MPGGRVKLDPSYGNGLTALVAGAPDREGGIGGWEASERGGQRPGKWFKAQPDDTASYDLILDVDNPAGGGPIEDRLGRLRKMGVRHSDHDEPPTITLIGDVSYGDDALVWVLENVTLGDRLYQGDGTLRRQAVTVSLSRYNGIDELEALTIRSGRTGKAHKKRRRVIHTKAGDTLRGVSLRELGSGSRWKEIQAWNKKKLKRVNPDARLRTGTALSIR